MTIQSIETKRIATVSDIPYANLFAPESFDGFEPYYRSTIRYTDPQPGERPDRVYSVGGQGATAYESEQEALSILQARKAAEVTTSYEKYLAANGAGMLDIA